MRVLFKTFDENHLVSDKEFNRLHRGFGKVGVELIRDGDCDLVMVKGFSHDWNQVKTYKYLHKKPVVLYSIGTEWKKGIDIQAANEPLRELYQKADAVIHVSDYCRKITEYVFGTRPRTYVIIPAEEAHLPFHYLDTSGPIKVVSTAIWRPIKRLPELRRVIEEINKKIPVELMVYGPPEGPMLDKLKEYHNYHFYIQLSRKEGMPNTILEALAYGLPCLVTNCGGAKEAIGMAGVVIENDPPDSEMFDLDNLEPIDYKKFEEGFLKMVRDIDHYRSEVRKRVTNNLNDLTMAIKFREVFRELV